MRPDGQGAIYRSLRWSEQPGRWSGVLGDYAKYRVNIYPNFRHYSEAEVQRWLYLRAIEWCAWPLFVSQPIVPLLLITFSPVAILLALIVADLLWRLVRYSFVSPRLASGGASFVIFLKWPCAIGSAIYLVFQHRYPVALLACAWPLFASFVSAPASLLSAVIGRHTQVGRVELEFAKRIGYVQPDATL